MFHSRDESIARLWRLHPDAQYFLDRGGVRLSPPSSCGISVTNRCNLRCEICGSQKYLDEANLPRRAMKKDVLLGVARTIFPFVEQVEINSLGEPLLYPEIETAFAEIAAHGCRLLVQSNGTLLSSRMVDCLLEQSGQISFSIDAVGALFNEVRSGGIWEDVDRGIGLLARRRSRERLQLTLYPTVTHRTVPDMLNVLKWAHDLGIDCVAFHRYDPIQNSFESRPTNDEMGVAIDVIAEWLSRHGDAPGVSVDQQVLKMRAPIGHVPRKRVLPGQTHPSEHAWTADDGHEYLCPAPFQHVMVGLDGEISACCFTQRDVLGYATSTEAFADAWLGPRYDELRSSLRLGSPRPAPQCAPCVERFVPAEIIRRSFERHGAIDALNRQLLGKRVLVYGAGIDSQTLLGSGRFDAHVVGIADTFRHGIEWSGFTVVSPDEIADLRPDVILVTPRHHQNQICADLSRRDLKAELLRFPAAGSSPRILSLTPVA